jgi:hypothetical protein
MKIKINQNYLESENGQIKFGQNSSEFRYSKKFNDASDYRNQFERLLRSYKKLEEIDKTWNPNDLNHYLDDIYCFFMNCYHLKDWLINDTKFPASQDDIENFVNSNIELQICADICNSHKHFKLKRSRSNKNPKVHRVDSIFKISGKGLQMGTKFIIETSTGILDTFDLATKCKNLWEDFISKYKMKVIA